MFGHWCHAHLNHAETQFGIPRNILKAIALTESGQYIKGKGMVAWPWTINVSGKGYFFETKEKAVQAARMLEKKGQKNFDMGCMQINNYHHGQAFASFEQAFDPKANVNYGAKFLKQLYDKNKSWNTAVGHYHSATPEHSATYLKLISRHLSKLTNDDSYMVHPTLQASLPSASITDKLHHKDFKKDSRPYHYQETYEGKHKLIRLVNHLNNLHIAQNADKKLDPSVDLSPEQNPQQQKKIGFNHLNTMKVTRFVPGNQPKVVQNGPVRVIRYHH